MAAGTGGFKVVSICKQLLVFCIFTQISSGQENLCTKNDIGTAFLPCNVTSRKTAIVYYLKKDCNFKHNSSHTIPPRKEIPCDCPPGKGILQEDLINRTAKCSPCQPGEYGVGGELISYWGNWNKTNNISGKYYDATTYCGDFLSKPDKCSSWRPSADGEYLTSGNPKNGTELKCFEQSVLIFNRMFVGQDRQNFISFRYKVDGAPCRKGSKNCHHGLSVSVNRIRVFQSDVQYQWNVKRIDVKPGPNQIAFVYQRSCSKDIVEDVAYMKEIAMVGSVKATTVCAKCPSGTYSSKPEANSCHSCSPNEYQPEKGNTTCLKCPKGSFSRLGATKCTPLPKCTTNDYYLLPDSVEKCTRDATGNWTRKQSVNLPNCPGLESVCIEVPEATDVSHKRPNNPNVTCTCTYGHYFDGTRDEPKCRVCSRGTYSDGTFVGSCKNCSTGQAAIPGFYLNTFDDKAIHPLLKQRCVGVSCRNVSDYWENRGSYMATKRLAGNFDAELAFENVSINYYNAEITLNCSLDCRMTPGGTTLAKHSHCYLKLYAFKDGKKIMDRDCVSHYQAKLRNGTERRHRWRLYGPGSYTFKAVFHHEDEANFSMLSYEARIHHVEITGALFGSARRCVKCAPGTRVSEDGAFCVKCPPGSYSKGGTSNCTRCSAGTFSNKNGSRECTPCGSGTTSKETRDGCDYNNCTFEAAPGVLYNLSPLKVVNGSMHKARTYNTKSHRYYPKLYFINVCSHDHDNNSCMVYRKDRSHNDIEEKLKTMVCMKWLFDRSHSYSIGEVLNFVPRKDKIDQGLILNITGGFRCWNKQHTNFTRPFTTIHMICDLNKGVGNPEPRSNFSAIDAKDCQYEFSWRTKYACPLCTPNDYKHVATECVNGRKQVTSTRVKPCLTDANIIFSSRACKQPSINKGLIAVLVVSIICIIILIVFVIYYARRNNVLRGKIFVPGKSFTKVLEDDQEELVDDMS